MGLLHLNGYAMLFRRLAYYLSSIFTLLLGLDNPLQTIKIFTAHSTPAGTVIQIRENGLKFRVRGKMDVWSVKETLLDRFYEKFGFTVQDGWKIVDIGGGIGDYTLFAAVGHSNARVLTFEPFPESYNLLRENVALNLVSNVELFSQAVASQDGSLDIISAPADPLSNQTTPYSEVGEQSPLTVSAVSLASILHEPDFPRIDLLKLDCEGAEYDILMNSRVAVLGKIDRIVMEYHDGITSFSHNDLVRYLKSNGYTVEHWPNPAHHHIGYLRAKRLESDQAG